LVFAPGYVEFVFWASITECVGVLVLCARPDDYFQEIKNK